MHSPPPRAADVSNLDRPQLFSVWNWFIDEQDTRQNTELKKSAVQSVYCVCHVFHAYFNKQVHKKIFKKIKQAKKFESLNFAESITHCAVAFRHTIYFFSSLIQIFVKMLFYSFCKFYRLALMWNMISLTSVSG